jgi:hypothetical protein
MGPRRESHQFMRIAVVRGLAGPARQIQNDGGRDRHCRVLDLVVRALGGERQPLFQILDRGDRLIIVLKLLLEATQGGIAIIGVADLDGEADKIRHGGRTAVHGSGLLAQRPGVARLTGFLMTRRFRPPSGHPHARIVGVIRRLVTPRS